MKRPVIAVIIIVILAFGLILWASNPRTGSDNYMNDNRTESGSGGYGDDSKSKDKTTTATEDNKDMAGKPNLFELTQGDTSLTKFRKQAMENDLHRTLAGTGPFTVFAPTNAAYGDMDKLDYLPEYYVVRGRVLTPSDLRGMDNQDLMTTEGDKITVHIKKTDDGSEIWIGNVMLNERHRMASNGILYTVDKPIVPTARDTSMDGAR
jgi:uncharacterized surface protein with fasciclin (FAS1) repeats